MGGAPAPGKRPTAFRLLPTSYFLLLLLSVAGGEQQERRASVTVTGAGGLTGLIQSALNQVPPDSAFYSLQGCKKFVIWR